jgi:hypothetical protein
MPFSSSITATTIDAPTMVLSSVQDYEKLWYQKQILAKLSRTIPQKLFFSCGTATIVGDDGTLLVSERFSGKRVRRKHFLLSNAFFFCKRGHGSNMSAWWRRSVLIGVAGGLHRGLPTGLRAYPNVLFKTLAVCRDVGISTACCDRNLRPAGRLMELSFSSQRELLYNYKGKRTRDDALDEKGIGE